MDFGKVAVVLLRMFYVDVVKPYGTPGGQQHDIQSRRRGEDVLKQMKSGKDRRARRHCSVCGHDSNIEESASPAAHLGVYFSRSRIFCCFPVLLLLRRKAESKVLEFLVARLGRGTLTRGPLDAATLRFLMTFLPLWLPCDGLRI